MTIQEAKEIKRHWLQNGYKYKEMPANVVEAIAMVEGVSTTTLVGQSVKVLNAAPPISKPAGIATIKAEAEPVLVGGLAEWVAEVEEKAKPTAKPKGGYHGPVVQDEFTQALAQLSEEQKTATPERQIKIYQEKQSLYHKRSYKKKAEKVSEKSTSNPIKNPAGNRTKVLPKPAEKPAQLAVKAEIAPEVIPQDSLAIPQTPTAIPPPPITKPVAGELQLMLSLFSEISAEMATGESLHAWPQDLVHQAAVVGEEAGELLRAALLYQYESGPLSAIRTQAIQTAATCLRLLKNLPQ